MFQGFKCFKVSNVSRLKPLQCKGTTFYLIIQIYADKIQKNTSPRDKVAFIFYTPTLTQLRVFWTLNHPLTVSPRSLQRGAASFTAAMQP